MPAPKTCPAEDAPAEPLRPQPSEASGTDLEAAAAAAPLARTRDDYDATASWTSWTPPAPAPPRRVYSAWDDVPDEHC